MKVLLFTLVRAFVFELAFEAKRIVKQSMIVQRPYVESKMDEGSQLPLLVKPYQRS